jgi:hypothetical protein
MSRGYQQLARESCKSRKYSVHLRNSLNRLCQSIYQRSPINIKNMLPHPLLQVEFDGVTGKVAFDDAGLRTDFKLDVLELGLNSEPKKVSKVGDLIITLDVDCCVPGAALTPLLPAPRSPLPAPRSPLPAPTVSIHWSFPAS